MSTTTYELTTYEFGNIVLVQFPFTNLAGSKKRPAVVVSSRAYNRLRLDVILMAVTTQLHAAVAFGETWITAWQAAGLLKPSAVKPVIFTFEKALVLKNIGMLQHYDQTVLHSAITSVFQ